MKFEVEPTFEVHYLQLCMIESLTVDYIKAYYNSLVMNMKLHELFQVSTSISWLMFFVIDYSLVTSTSDDKMLYIEIFDVMESWILDIWLTNSLLDD